MNDRCNGMAIAIVHNQDATRNAAILPRLDQLTAALELGGPVMQFQAGAQPEARPHGVRLGLVRDFLHFQLQRDWARYRLHETKSPVRALRGFIKDCSRKYLRSSEEATRSLRKHAIEALVTDKHIRLWQQFLDTEMRYLIVFEDDAVFRDTSIENVLSLRARLALEASARPIYIDLAGGCIPAELGIDHLLAEQDTHFRRYRKPVTNTACAYLVNRAMVTLFVEHLVRHPWLRLISIDWLMNKLFILSDLQEDQALCLHADPTVFVHGSTTGHYFSWQK